MTCATLGTLDNAIVSHNLHCHTTLSYLVLFSSASHCASYDAVCAGFNPLGVATWAFETHSLCMPVCHGCNMLKRMYIQHFCGGCMPNCVSPNCMSTDAALVRCFLLDVVLAMQIRESSEDTELGGFKLPAGTKVGINVLGMHHDPKHFPDPQVGNDFLLAVAMLR